MSYFNKVILIGRLTHDPELRYTTTGKPVASFSLAVDRPRFGAAANPQQQKETDFFRVTAWDKLAEICSKYYNKGSLVVVEGRLQNRSYTANDGTQRTVTEIVASDARALGGRREGATADVDVPHPAEAVGVGVGASRTPTRPPVPAGDNIDDMGMDDIPF